MTLIIFKYDVGQEPVNNPDAYDILWNNESRLIRFRTSKIPTAASEIKVGGRPFLPVIAKVRDYSAILATQSAEGGSGEHQSIIFDKSIKTKEGARERARAELYAYARSMVEGEFQTYTDGFVAGQKVRVNSTLLGIDEYYIVNKVSTKMWTPSEPVYSVSFVTSKTMGIIEVLQYLLTKDKLGEKRDNEIEDLVESAEDTMTLVDTITAVEDYAESDTYSLLETTTAQSLDYDVKFVVGAYIPSFLWTSPTGFEDTANDWVDEANAYDGDTGTKAQLTASINLVDGEYNMPFLTLTHAGIDTSHIRIYSDNGDYDWVDIDAYYSGTWNDVYEGLYTPNVYNTVPILDGKVNVTKVRLRLRSAVTGLRTAYIYEVGLGKPDFTDTKRVFVLNGSILG